MPPIEIKNSKAVIHDFVLFGYHINKDTKS